MSLYNVALFAHIIGAIILVGVGFIAPLIVGGATRAQSASSFVDWANVIIKASKAAGAAAVAVLISGLYMGLTAYSFTAGWLAVGLVLFVINGGLATGVLGKHWDSLLARAEEAGDGPVPAELRSAVVTPRLHAVESFMLASDLVILFLMTNKPGWTGSAAAVAVGLALTGVLIVRGTRHHTAAIPNVA